MMKNRVLDNILNQAIDSKKVFGTSFCLKYKGESWCGASGDLTEQTQYFIASTTKLFVTAIILNFRSKGLLHLDDPISRYLDKNILTGLHTFNGKDYAQTITIRNLLAHTSGIPDYFHQKDNKGKSLENDLTSGHDRSWTFEEALGYSKALNPLFVPNAKGKAHYSDTNFQLLGRIIESITNKPISDNFRELIFEPLGLTKTYLYTDVADRKPKAFYFKNKPLVIPKAIASFGPDGGAVSTSQEMLIFIEAFFGGFFFPENYVNELQSWNRIFFPMHSGIGIHRFKLPWIFNPLGTLPDLIGHSGLSGSLAYYSPARNLYITGTVNQVAFPDTSFRLAIKLIQQVMKE